MARVVFFLIGCLLCVTAFLKLWMLLTDPFADITAQMPRTILWFAFFVELSLVLVLASRFDVTLKWGATILVFVGFWTFSFVRLILGYSSCGCTGSISVPPSISVILNTGFLAILVYCHPPAPLLAAAYARCRMEMGSVQTRGRILNGRVLPFALACGCVVAFALVFARFSSSSALSAEPVDVGSIAFGETITFDCQIRNLTTSRTRILGSKSACNCLMAIQNGASIRGGGVLVQQWHLKAKKEGPLRQRLVFYTDNPIQGSVYVNVTGVVLPLPCQ